MSNFLTFEENQVLINNNLFPANSVSLQMNANTVPVKDIYGNLLYYSPTGPIQGTVGLNFFLTGTLPSYFRLENQDETPIKIAFNNIVIPDCYLTNLSFSVKPFEPIPVRADLVFYHGIRALNTYPLILNEQRINIPANGIAYSNSLFNSSLNTLMGTSSYILTDDRSSFSENPVDFIVTDFDYQFSVERVPVLRVGDTFPLRVAMKEANAEFTITSNNLDGYLDIHGNTAIFSAVLKDNTDLNVNDTVNLTGIIVDQSYEISEDNYGLSKIKMTQALNRKRTPVTIPMEVSDPNIVTPPTVNTVNPIVIPGSSVITTQIIKEERPNRNDPEQGTGTTPNPEPEKPDDYIYFTILFDLQINLLFNNEPVVEEILLEKPPFGSTTLKVGANSYNAKFEVLNQPNRINKLNKISNFDSYVLDNVLGCSFRVDENFKNYFSSSDLFNKLVNDNENAFFFKFNHAKLQQIQRFLNYNELNDIITEAITPIGGNGKKQTPYIIKMPSGNCHYVVFFVGQPP